MAKKVLFFSINSINLQIIITNKIIIRVMENIRKMSMKFMNKKLQNNVKLTKLSSIENLS